jgi:hypothetical protein
MKLFLFISFSFAIVMNGYSQKYMDVIAEKACSCSDQISDTLENKEYTIKIGLCMLDASMPYKKQIKKDYGIDMDNIGSEGPKWGQIIGAKMASVCPDKLISLSQKVNSQPVVKDSPLTVSGTITKIEKDFFVVFSLKDESGKITRFYWLTFVNSDLDFIAEYESLMGKFASITYSSQDFFDPRISDYRSVNIIKKFDLISDNQLQ